MIRLGGFLVSLALLVSPVAAQETPSQAGTAFVRVCLADVTASRIALLKEQAPDFAASLSEEELMAGARGKAERACPCFLHVIGTSALGGDVAPEERVSTVVTYLDSLDGDAPAPFPPVLATVTKLCGERSSVLPRRWYER